MSKAVLELNDYSLGLYVDAALVGSSPGYVLATAGKAQFGHHAVEQSRLHPVSTNNEFWYRLSMQPLRRPFAHFRHYADIAHAHLMHLAHISDYQGDIVIAVPGSFSREQLGILSGVIKQSPFNATAMFDASLLSAASRTPDGGMLIVADMQLHQFSLTVLTSEQQQLRREAVVVVQGVGWDSISNALVQVINDAFIEQSRFNPQHSAQWEQHLYNELPEYLKQLQQGQSDLLVHINTDKASHQARISASELIAAMEPSFLKIRQQLQHLYHEMGLETDIPLLTSARAARIPGLTSWLQSAGPAISGEELAQACLQAATEMPAAGGVVPYVTSLRVHQQSLSNLNSQQRSANSSAQRPTHLLIGHNAFSLDRPCVLHRVDDQQRGEIYGHSHQSDLQLSYDCAQAAVVLAITPTPMSITLQAVNGGVSVNERVITGNTELVAGDRVALSGKKSVMQLIKVCDGQG
jgi:hypothetical protein